MRTLLLLLLLLTAPLEGQLAVTLENVETHGTFHAGGVELTISGDDDADASASLEIRPAGAANYRPAQAPVRVAPDRFLGSLFDLAPGAVYQIRVTLDDPDGVTGGSPTEAFLTTAPDVRIEPGLRTLWVDPDGDDDATGTSPGEALETIQEAADRALAGDLIRIAPGTYRESVHVSASGTAGQPIVFRGDGAGVVLDGADPAIAAGVPWTPEGDGSYSIEPGFPTGHVVTEAGRLFRYESQADLAGLPAGAPGGFRVDGQGRLHLKLSTGTSPADHTVHVARHEDGFYLDAVEHVRIENVELRHYGAGDFGKGVYLRYSNHCAVLASRIHEVGTAGIWIKGGGGHLIEHNQIWDTSIIDWPWDWTKGSSAENNAVTLTDDIQPGNVIRRNEIRGTFNGVGACGSDPPSFGISVETDLYENRLASHTDDAFEPEGHCANVRLWSNEIRDSHMAFAVAPAAPGPVYLVRNIGYDIGNTRSSQIDGYSSSVLKINSGYPTPVGPHFLFHNSFLTSAPGTNAVTLLNPGESTFLVARNNVFAGTRYVLEKINPVTLDWDFDALHTTDPGRFVRWEGTSLTDLAALRNQTGQELSGLAAPPDLVDPDGGDFTPLPTSALVDAGQILPGINDGFTGTAPDIGAIEAGPLFADGFETGTTQSWTSSTP